MHVKGKSLPWVRICPDVEFVPGKPKQLELNGTRKRGRPRVENPAWTPERRAKVERERRAKRKEREYKTGILLERAEMLLKRLVKGRGIPRAFWEDKEALLREMEALK